MKVMRWSLKKVNLIFNPERKHIYFDEETKKLKVNELPTEISSYKYFMESLDWVNIVQSLHELKVYVSYLLNKDKEPESLFSCSQEISNDSQEGQDGN